MHELVWRLWSRETGKKALAPLPADPGQVTLACFGAGGRDPVWIAKIARDAAGRQRLRQERAALAQLAPWRTQLLAPGELDWQETEADACLIESGLGGRLRYWRTRRDGLRGHGGELAESVVAWIIKFQSLVAPPRAVSVRELAAEYAAALRSSPGKWPPPDWADALEDASAGSEPRPAAPIHGDLWFGNCLWREGLSGITDWCGFDAGSPLDDLLSFLIKCPARPRERHSLFRAYFFEDCALMRQTRAWAARLAPPPAWRLCFYLFLARRLRWEAGLANQPRSEQERADARAEWTPTLAWLRERRFPAPWS
ncbi:MAG TPA: phosphotransferase [Terriglobales bacterium]|nr:phosphotransferase [Terriglobales bacterium]